MASVKDLIAQKKAKKANKNLTMDDINHDLIVALTAISVYGKAARDEEIMRIILGRPAVSKKMRNLHESMVTEFEASKKKQKLVRGKDGFLHDKNGFIVMEPKSHID